MLETLSITSLIILSLLHSASIFLFWANYNRSWKTVEWFCKLNIFKKFSLCVNISSFFFNSKASSKRDSANLSSSIVDSESAQIICAFLKFNTEFFTSIFSISYITSLASLKCFALRKYAAKFWYRLKIIPFSMSKSAFSLHVENYFKWVFPSWKIVNNNLFMYMLSLAIFSSSSLS